MRFLYSNAFNCIWFVNDHKQCSLLITESVFTGLLQNGIQQPGCHGRIHHNPAISDQKEKPYTFKQNISSPTLWPFEYTATTRAVLYTLQVIVTLNMIALRSSGSTVIQRKKQSMLVAVRL